MAVMNLEEFKKNVTDEMIFPALMRADWNEEILKNLPHRNASDLALYYCVKIWGVAIKVSNALAHEMGWSENWLYQTAVQNATNNAKIQTMAEVLEELSGIKLDAPDGPEMYVLTYGSKEPLGAGSIVSLLNSGDEKIKSLRLIPSSIHEWILIPECLSNDFFTNQMIQDINVQKVAPEDRLSDHVYSFADLSGFANAG